MCSQATKSELEGAYLREALDGISDLFIIVDDKFNSVYCNLPAQKLFSCSHPCVCPLAHDGSRRCRDLDFAVAHLSKTLMDSGATRLTLRQYESGRAQHIEYSVSQFKESGSNKLHYILIGRNVTDRIERFDDLRREAHRDRVTGLLNRSGGESLLKDTGPGVFGTGAPYAIIMLDIDCFKAINDTFGHSIGDQALQRIADVMRRSVRPDDAIIRWGGDEFLIALNNVDSEVAAKLAERIRLAVEKVTDPTFGRFTTSVGVGVKRADESPDDLIARVDSALYKAKETGRNKVIVADLPFPNHMQS